VAARAGSQAVPPLAARCRWVSPSALRNLGLNPQQIGGRARRNPKAALVERAPLPLGAAVWTAVTIPAPCGRVKDKESARRRLGSRRAASESSPEVCGRAQPGGVNGTGLGGRLADQGGLVGGVEPEKGKPVGSRARKVWTAWRSLSLAGPAKRSRFRGRAAQCSSDLLLLPCSPPNTFVLCSHRSPEHSSSWGRPPAEALVHGAVESQARLDLRLPSGSGILIGKADRDSAILLWPLGRREQAQLPAPLKRLARASRQRPANNRRNQVGNNYQGGGPQPILAFSSCLFVFDVAWRRTDPRLGQPSVQARSWIACLECGGPPDLEEADSLGDRAQAGRATEN